LLEIYYKIQEKYIGINQNILTKQKAQLRKFWRTQKAQIKKKLPASAINRHNSKNASERTSSGVERLVGTDLVVVVPVVFSQTKNFRTLH